MSEFFLINDVNAGRAIARASFGGRGGGYYNPDCDQNIARLRDGKLLGGVVYDLYCGASINIHMAGFDPRWANRDMLWAAFHYPFEQLKVKRLFGRVQASNTKSVETCLRLGFTEAYRIADVFPDGDLLVMSMYIDQCRWLDWVPRGRFTSAEEYDGKA